MQLKLVNVTIAADGEVLIDIGPGTHGADCADIIYDAGHALGVITRHVWRPEVNCAGDCGKCETNYHARMRERQTQDRGE
jgi:hypothetical protein